VRPSGIAGGTERWLLLTWRKLLFFALAWVAAVLLHNLTYALLQEWLGEGGDEPIFFLLAVVVLPGWLVVALVYSAIHQIKRRMAGGAPDEPPAS